MARSFTQTGILFSIYNNTEAVSVSVTVKQAGVEGLDEDNFGIVNAVDIAWNGANLSSAVSSIESAGVPEGLAVGTINTTGELLKVIAQKSSLIIAKVA